MIRFTHTSKSFRSLTIVASLLLLLLRGSASFLHSDSCSSLESGVHLNPATCSACDLETTQVLGTDDPVTLPEEQVQQIVVYCTVESQGYPCTYCFSHSLRGPPTLS